MTAITADITRATERLSLRIRFPLEQVAALDAQYARQEGRQNAKALRRRVDKLLNAARERCDQSN
jgi:hypothetical protein